MIYAVLVCDENVGWGG